MDASDENVAAPDVSISVIDESWFSLNPAEAAEAAQRVAVISRRRGSITAFAYGGLLFFCGAEGDKWCFQEGSVHGVARVATCRIEGDEPPGFSVDAGTLVAAFASFPEGSIVRCSIPQGEKRLMIKDGRSWVTLRKLGEPGPSEDILNLSLGDWSHGVTTDAAELADTARTLNALYPDAVCLMTVDAEIGSVRLRCRGRRRIRRSLMPVTCLERASAPSVSLRVPTAMLAKAVGAIDRCVRTELSFAPDRQLLRLRAVARPQMASYLW